MSSVVPIHEFNNFKRKPLSGYHISEMNEMQQAVQVPIPHSTSGMNNNNQQLNNPLIISSQAVQIVLNIYGLSQSSSAGGQDILQDFFRYVGQSQTLVDESAIQTMSHIFVGSTKTQSPVVNVINGNHDSTITSIRDQQHNNIFAGTISLCNGYLPTCLTPYPTPNPSHLKPFEFINSHVESREQVVLNCTFNDIYNKTGFVHDGNNNEHFYDTVFDYGEILSYTPAPASPTTIDFETIDTGVSGIIILAREFGLYVYESNIA